MNKKITSVLLTLLYLVNNTGFAMNLNYVSYLLSGEEENSCMMESCSMEDMNCSMDAYSCKMDMASTGVNITTINDFVNDGIIASETNTCQPQLLILITNTDIINAINKTISNGANLNLALVNNFDYLLKKLQTASASEPTFSISTVDAVHHKEPLFIEYGRLILYS